jgi:hypothetical protein
MEGTVVPQAPGSFQRMSKMDPTDGALRHAIRQAVAAQTTIIARVKRAAQQGTSEELERLLGRAATLVENLRRLHAQLGPEGRPHPVESSGLPTVSASMTARSPVRLDGAERLLREATA